MTHAHNSLEKCAQCEAMGLYDEAPTAMHYSAHHAIEQPQDQGQLFDPALFNDRRGKQ